MAKRAAFYEFIEMLEKTWNKTAWEYVRKERLKIPENSFRISAEVDYNNERGVKAKVQAGPVNQIYIMFPQKNYRRAITETLDYISNPNVHRDPDLEEQIFNGSVVHELYSAAIIRRKSNKRVRGKNWKKYPDGDNRVYKGFKFLNTKKRDKGDYIAVVETVNTVKVKHKATGINVEIKDKEGREVWDMLQEAFHTCSLKVHELQEEKEEKRPKTDLVHISDIINSRFMHELLHSHRFSPTIIAYVRE